MEFLVKKSIIELNKNLDNLKKQIEQDSTQLENEKNNFLSEIQEYAEILQEQERSIKNLSESIKSQKNDYFMLDHFRNTYLSGDLDLCNLIVSNFDTYLRESIPMIVWELMGNSLVYEKNHLIKKEDLSLVPNKVSTILKAYANGLSEYAEKLETDLLKSHSKISESLNKEKDNLLLECLNKLKQQDDPESQSLVKRIKNTLN